MSYLDVNFAAKFHLKYLSVMVAAAAPAAAAAVVQGCLCCFAHVNFPSWTLGTFKENVAKPLSQVKTTESQVKYIR